MAENVGEIYFDVDADTGNLLDSTKVVNKATSDIGQDFNRLGKQTDKANKKMAGFSRSAGQVGIQFQQLVGQIQGGQSVFGALSAQMADIGIVVDAPLAGAIAGISAAFAGALLPTLFSNKTALEKVEAITAKLATTLKKASDGTIGLADEIGELNKVSSALARLKISSSFADAQKQIDLSMEGIRKASRELSQFTTITSDQFYELGLSYEDLAKTIESNDISGLIMKGLTVQELAFFRNDINAISDQFKITTEQALRFSVALTDVQRNTNPITIKAFENALSDLNDETGGSNKELNKLAAEVVPLFAEFKSGVDNVNLLRQAFADINREIEKTSKATTKQQDLAKQLNQTLAIQAAKLNDGALAAKRLAVAFELGLSSVEELPKGIDETLIKIDELGKKEAELREKRQSDKSSTVAFERIESTTTRELESPAEREERQLNERLAVIRKYEELETADLERAQKARENAHESYSKNIERIETQRRQMMLSAGENTFLDLSDIAKAFAGEQSGIYKGLFLASKAFSIAQSIIAINTGVAQALSLPFPLNLAAAGTVAAQGASIISTVQSTKYAGRQFGGPIEAGKPYRINETGVESFVNGNNQYLLSGKSGKVINAKDTAASLQGGGGVVINNYGEPMNASVSQQGDQKIIELMPQIVRDTIGSDMNNRTGVFDSMTSNTNLTGRAR